MRVTGAVTIRNQSPSQGSSRSAGRSSRMRIPAEVAAAEAARQYDAGLLASAAQQIQRGHMPHPMYHNQTPIDFQQMLAQIAGTNHHELEQQLCQGTGFVLDNASPAAKLEAALSGCGRRPKPEQIGVPNMFQSPYDAALAAVAWPQMGPNAIAMKNQAFLRMAPNSLTTAPTNPAMSQNIRDMSNLTGLQLVMRMPEQAHGNNVMNFMPTTTATPGLQNPALSNRMDSNVTGKFVGQGKSMNLLSSTRFFKKCLEPRL
ncbi:hypothetical protein FGB62_270g01 [Gracilaria domingensis]|nr:hypothetical protein FGB62_270g01 [Gracilaria domingensis]